LKEEKRDGRQVGGQIKMKIARSRLKEIIQEELEMYSDEPSEDMMGDPEYDQEGYMTKSELYKIGKYALELHDMIEGDDNLPEWMQSKVSKMAQMIGDVKHALEYDQMHGEFNQHQEEPTYDDYSEEGYEEEEEMDEY
jgi:hypothetical protein